MSSFLGLRPPPLGSSLELRWVLEAVFGAKITQCVNPEGAVHAASLLGVGERIWARWDADALASALSGSEHALARAHLAARVAHGHVDAALSSIAQANRAVGAPLVLLKYAALAISGVCPVGSRDARDLDVLVPAAAAPALFTELVRMGFRARNASHPSHHLPGLSRADGQAIEIHTYLPGLVHAGEPIQARTLLALTSSVTHGGEDFRLPPPDLVLAHLLVHGFVQHLRTPFDYPLMRTLCDAADLGMNQPSFRTRSVLQFIQGSPGQLELLTMHRLLQTLGEGRLPAPGTWDDELLRHVVSAGTISAYQRHLHRRRTLDALLQLPARGARTLRTVPRRGAMLRPGGRTRGALS